MIYQVNNVSKRFSEYKYAVIRDCQPDVKAFFNGDESKRYWYWGCFNDVTSAQKACDAIGNGVLIETTDLEPLSYGAF